MQSFVFIRFPFESVNMEFILWWKLLFMNVNAVDGRNNSWKLYSIKMVMLLKIHVKLNDCKHVHMARPHLHTERSAYNTSVWHWTVINIYRYRNSRQFLQSKLTCDKTIACWFYVGKFPCTQSILTQSIVYISKINISNNEMSNQLKPLK